MKARTALLGRKSVFLALAGWMLFADAGSLFEDFVRPPDEVKPWCYWYWVNGNADDAQLSQVQDGTEQRSGRKSVMNSCKHRRKSVEVMCENDKKSVIGRLTIIL